MKRIGILGGTFNPVHNGHLHIAKGFRDRLGLDRVILIPVAAPPHKNPVKLAAGRHRLEMCGLACEGEEGLEVSDLELRRRGKSYTADTLRTLHESDPEDCFYFIMGADMFVTLEHWRNFEDIARLSVLCTAARHKGELEGLLRYKQKLEQNYHARCRIEDLPVMDISSTRVREILAGGQLPTGLVPDRVIGYIKRHGLYSFPQKDDGQDDENDRTE